MVDKKGTHWSDDELDAVVEAYLRMLEKELQGRSYSKADANRRLREGHLEGRTKASVEYRMQNISATLQELGLRWIEGYKPAKNVGAGVKERIRTALSRNGVEGLDSEDHKPTADEHLLVDRVRRLRRRGGIPSPTGSKKPRRVNSSSTAFVREPLVRAWVLEEANGICEGCGLPGPFLDEEGWPFLEVHHVLPLADGGSDQTSNAVALCPNCHRRSHLSRDRRFR